MSGGGRVCAAEGKGGRVLFVSTDEVSETGSRVGMGIQGLLCELRAYERPTHVSEFKGQRVGIDVSGWLHRAVYGCSWALGSGEGFRAGFPLPYVEYVLFRCRMLRHHGVEPLLVFDGRALGAKAEEDAGRKERREAMLAEGRAAMENGDRGRAAKCFERASLVTAEVRGRTLEGLRAEGFQYIVAPYEADAQLAYLATNRGLVDPKSGKGLGVAAVITEDSDLLAYGCPNVLYKMDKFGACVLIRHADILKGTAGMAGGKVEGGGKDKGKGGRSSLAFDGWCSELFMIFCAMSGCDFLDSIPGVGPKRAHAVADCFRDNVGELLAWLRECEERSGATTKAAAARDTGEAGTRADTVGGGEERGAGVMDINGAGVTPGGSAVSVDAGATKDSGALLAGQCCPKRAAKAAKALGQTALGRIPAGYSENLAGTLLVFKHQRVICPVDLRCTEQSPLPPELESQVLDHIGPRIPDSEAADLARGVVEPGSGLLYVDILRASSVRGPRTPGCARGRSDVATTPRGSTGKGIPSASTPLKQRKYIDLLFQTNVLSPPKSPPRRTGIPSGLGSAGTTTASKVRPATAAAATFYASADRAHASEAIPHFASEESRKSSAGSVAPTPRPLETVATPAGRGVRDTPASPVRPFPDLVDLTESEPLAKRRVTARPGLDPRLATAQKPAKGSKRRADDSSVPLQRKITSFFSL